MQYTIWSVSRFFKRFTAYMIVLPIAIVLAPFTLLGNLSVRLYNELRYIR